MKHSHTHKQSTKPGFTIPVWLATSAFLGIAALLLWEEHEAHILGALPYLLLLACALIHLFMHRGHGHGGHGSHGDDDDDAHLAHRKGAQR